jgi:hypothetical protein
MVKPKSPQPRHKSVTVINNAHIAKTRGNFDCVFRENIGNSQTKRYEVTPIKENKNTNPQIGVVQTGTNCGEFAIPMINKAFAGVGIPIKLQV